MPGRLAALALLASITIDITIIKAGVGFTPSRGAWRQNEADCRALALPNRVDPTSRAERAGADLGACVT